MADLIHPVHGEISFSYDSHGVLQARNSLGELVDTADLMGDRIERSTNRSNRGFASMRASLARVGSALLTAAKYATIASSAAVALVGSIHLIAAAAAALAPAIGAGLAALPGVLLASAAAVLVIRGALAGVKEALSAAFDSDPAKFEEAIKGLAPNAQAAAKAFRSDIVPAIKSVQQNIQQVAFTGLAQKVSALRESFTELRGESGGVGAALNVVLGRVLDFGATSSAVAPMRTALLTVKNILHNIGEGITPVLEGLFSLAGQLTSIGANTGMESIAEKMTQFGEFLKGIDLKAVFASVMPALQPVLGLFQDIGTIAKAIFGALQADGANALGVFGELINKIAEFVSSAEGEAALNALGQAMQAIAGAAGQAFMSLLQALAPVIVALSPAIEMIAGIVGDALSGAFTALAPVLLEVAEALGGALMTALPALADAFGSLAPVVGPIVETLGSGLAATLRFLGPLIADLAPVIVGLVAAFALWKIAIVAISVVQGILNAVMMANPIGLIVLAIVALVAALVLAYKRSETFRAIISALGETFTQIWTAIKTAFTATVDFIGNLLSALGQTFTQAWDGIKSGVSSAWEAVKSFVSSAVEAVSNFIQNGVQGWIRIFDLLSELPGKVWGFLKSMVQKFVEMNVSIFNTVKELPGKILNALGNLGELLVNAGRDVINGLFRGISEMAGKVLDKAREIANKVRDTVAGALGISSPSKVMIELGKFTGEGLALGLGASADMIRRAAMSAAANIVMPVQAMATTAPAIGRTAVPTSNTTVYNANQTVNALPGQSARELGDASMRRLMFTLKNGA